MKLSDKVTLQIGDSMIRGVPLADAVRLAQYILEKAYWCEDVSRRADFSVPVAVFSDKK